MPSYRELADPCTELESRLPVNLVPVEVEVKVPVTVTMILSASYWSNFLDKRKSKIDNGMTYLVLIEWCGVTR